MKRLIGNVLILAAAAAILAFFAAPAVGFFAIRSAAEAGDIQGLSRLIDFAAVRQSLRPQLIGRPEAMAPAPSFLEDPIGAVRRRLEEHPILDAPDVDAYLTPPASRLSHEARGVTPASGPKPVLLRRETENPGPGRSSGASTVQEWWFKTRADRAPSSPSSGAGRSNGSWCR